MKIHKPYVIKTKDLDAPHSLHILGDWHLYHKSCREKMIEKMIEDIRKDKNASALSVGDLAECIVWGDKRFNPKDIHPKYHSRFFDVEGLATQILLDISHYLRPIKDKLIGVGEGNHEFKFGINSRMWDAAIVGDLAKHLGTRFLGYSSTFPVVFQCGRHKRTFQLYTHHGEGGGATKASKIRSLARNPSICEADIYVQGHGHEQLDIWPVRLYQDAKGHLSHKQMLCVMTGSFLAAYEKNVTSYAEIKKYDPVPLGNVAIEIVPNTRKLVVNRMCGVV